MRLLEIHSFSYLRHRHVPLNMSRKVAQPTRTYAVMQFEMFRISSKNLNIVQVKAEKPAIVS